MKKNQQLLDYSTDRAALTHPQLNRVARSSSCKQLNYATAAPTRSSSCKDGDVTDLFQNGTDGKAADQSIDIVFGYGRNLARFLGENEKIQFDLKVRQKQRKSPQQRKTPHRRSSFQVVYDSANNAATDRVTPPARRTNSFCTSQRHLLGKEDNDDDDEDRTNSESQTEEEERLELFAKLDDLYCTRQLKQKHAFRLGRNNEHLKKYKGILSNTTDRRKMRDNVQG